MVGATALDLAKNIDVLKSSDIPLFILGLVSSYVTAILAITYFLKFVKNHSLAIFGYYRIVLAIIVLLVLVL
jgi:undecaprenyl-diphosphatase